MDVYERLVYDAVLMAALGVGVFIVIYIIKAFKKMLGGLWE